MSILGALLTVLASIGYTFRYSFVKDLSKYKVSKESVNLFYRVTSFPFILLIALIFNTNLFEVSGAFITWFIATLLVNVFFGIYQVYLYQKHDFSSVEGLAFLEILFTTIAGAIFFNELLVGKQLIGIGVIIFAFVLLTLFELKSKKVSINYLEIIFYYLFVTAINLFNKQSIKLSSPFTYAVYLTLGLIIVNYIIILFKKGSLYRLENKSANKLLLLVGLMAAISFVSINFGYKLLPVGIVSALISFKTFFSLWISNKKYGETNLLPKTIAAIIALIGIIIIFL